MQGIAQGAWIGDLAAVCSKDGVIIGPQACFQKTDVRIAERVSYVISNSAKSVCGGVVGATNIMTPLPFKLNMSCRTRKAGWLL